MQWSTDQSKRWHLHGGVGVGYGFSIKSTIEAYHFQEAHLKSTEQSYVSGLSFLNESFEDGLQENRSFSKGSTWFDFNFFIPIGVNFRLSKKDNFFQKAQLFTETTPMIYLNLNNGFRTASGTIMQTVGLKFDI
jgi:hypothetical protein